MATIGRVIPFPAPRVIIVRGLPGTGVSTMARAIADEGGGSLVAVDIPSESHGYFSSWRRATAFADTLQITESHFAKNEPLIVVDRHHVRHWEMKELVSTAIKAGYVVSVTATTAQWSNDDEACASRSSFKLSALDIAILRGHWQEGGAIEQILSSHSTRDEAIQSLRAGDEAMGDAAITWLLRQGYLKT